MRSHREAPDTTRDATSSRSVLIVEDDADIRETLLLLLGDNGYHASACANGLDALKQLRHGLHVDLILLDLMLPVMNGWQFRVQQKADPLLASIPVVALSADTSAQAAAIDADAYLRKPIDYDTLLSGLERTLLAAERRRLQATLVETERLAALGTLAAGVAHEINNPLAYVMANRDYVAAAIQRGGARADDVRLQEALSEMRDGCERIRAIVQDLRLFSRAPDDDEMAVDVRRVLDTSANIVIGEIRSRAKLTKEYGDVPLLKGSATRLGQVFLNLVLNAAHAIPEGEPSRNEIRLVTRAQNGAIFVEVHDTGGGIAAEIRGRIFEPFFTTKRLGEGTGLGLSISHRIVSAMGGAIAVESVVGEGTTFVVRLPVVESPAREAPLGPTRPVAVHRASILVIDDEVMIGTALKRALDSDHDVEVTTSPDAAIARIARGDRFDLILCDMMMPGRNGIEVHRAIASSAPDQARRMVFLTGGACTAIAREFLADPTRLVVQKPFDTDSLRARIGEALASFEPSG